MGALGEILRLCFKLAHPFGPAFAYRWHRRFDSATGVGVHHVGLRGDATEQDARTPLQEKPWLMGGIVGSTLPPELASVTLAS
ncbi:MAG: hypothetical protein EBU59_09045 [Planctomycetia bacterium]|nr:hypothetical protein [Planctomycetia bacterium]